MGIDEYFELARVNDPKIKGIYPEQESMANAMYFALQKPNTTMVSQGPVGMGKALVICVVAASLADEGKRILICSPTYSHSNATIHDSFKKIGKDPPILYGVSRYFRMFKHKCPLNVANITNHVACNSCTEKKCRIIRDREICDQSQIVLTSHALIVSRSSIPNSFGVIFIDECHGYPDVVQNATTEGVTFKMFKQEIDRLKQFPDLEKKAKTTFKAFTKVSSQGSNYWHDKLKTSIKQLGNTVSTLNISSEILKYTDRISEIKSSNGRLNITRIRAPPKYKEELSIGLVSATIEDPRALAKECEFGSKIFAPPSVVRNLSERFRERFDRRPIFGLSDGPNLKILEKSYTPLRKKANRIICGIVKNFPDSVLILCRNNRDATSIQKSLIQLRSLSSRVMLCDNITEEDLDDFEDIVNKRVEIGENIIIATASSRLWEGANIMGIKLLIIDSLPYRRPRIDEVEKGLRGWFKSPGFRFMIRRLQQGIGRLVREDGEWGIVIIIDGRLYSGGNRILKHLPTWISGPHIFQWTMIESVSKQIHSVRRRMISGETGRRIKNLDHILKEMS